MSDYYSSEYVKGSVSDKHQSKLREIKQTVQDSFSYFDKNNQRYVDFMKFICDTALSDDARQKLVTMNKPPVEFNECEAYINRQLGEFVKQQPSFEVMASGSVGIEDITPDLTSTIKAVENYLRYILSPEKTDNISYKTFEEMLKGGFSVWRISTDYQNEMSFDQEINIKKEPYPTMCFWDPMATESHKGDGDYCGRIIAYKKEDAERMFGKEVSEGASFSQAFGKFNWSYENNGQKVILICEYYKKKKKSKKIVQLSNGTVLFKKEYNRMLELWEEAGYLEQPPVIVQERMTDVESICRYLMSETKVISYEETDFKHFPLIFFDGSSVMLQDQDGGSKHQMTRPYVYHLKGIQQVKNTAGQAMAYEIENTVAHKFFAAIESIDMTQLDQWRNVQIADVLLYQAFRNGNSDEPLPAPREVQRTQIPEIIPHTFYETSKTMQAILGSYDAQLGIQGNDISGKAIMQGAMQSSACIAPYIMGFINGMNRASQIVIDLIPKYYKTPRTIPIMEGNGRKGYQVINDKRNPNSISLDYDPNHLNVVVQAGVNTDVQKQMAIQQITMLMKASPVIAQFVAEDGLEFLLDNIDMRNIDSFKEKVGAFVRNLKEQQAKQPKIDPMQVKQQELAMKNQSEQQNLLFRSQKLQQETALEGAKLELENRQTDIDFMTMLSKVKEEEQQTAVKSQQAQSENVRSDALMAIELSKHMREEKNDKFDRIERALVHHDKINHEKKKHEDGIKLEHRKIDESNRKIPGMDEEQIY